MPCTTTTGPGYRVRSGGRWPGGWFTGWPLLFTRESDEKFLCCGLASSAIADKFLLPGPCCIKSLPLAASVLLVGTTMGGLSAFADSGTLLSTCS